MSSSVVVSEKSKYPMNFCIDENPRKRPKIGESEKIDSSNLML